MSRVNLAVAKINAARVCDNVNGTSVMGFDDAITEMGEVYPEVCTFFKQTFQPILHCVLWYCIMEMTSYHLCF